MDSFKMRGEQNQNVHCVDRNVSKLGFFASDWDRVEIFFLCWEGLREGDHHSNAIPMIYHTATFGNRVVVQLKMDTGQTAHTTPMRQYGNMI